MAGIPDDKVQEVRNRVDIVDLIGRYVELRSQGGNFKGLCPFHEEKTPSFNVSPGRRGYKCFGCQVSGDAITFVREIEGKSFPEAVRKLAEMYGVDLPVSSGADDSRARTERDECYEILKVARDLYQQILSQAPEGEAGRKYRDQRGISEDGAETFAIGYAPAPSEAGWDRLVRTLAERKLSLERAEELGLVGRSQRTNSLYDRFRGRLMFPVIEPGGETIAFSGRIVPPHDEPADGVPAPKYVNSSESLLFHKGKALFGLHAARPAIRQKGRAILVEGNLDVVSLYQRGHAETVAPLGTALTGQQAHLLARFTEQVILCFDGDDAGKKAAAKALPLLLAEDLDARIVLLPAGEDPDSMNPETFTTLLARARPALEVMMERLAARAGTSIDGRARALDRVAPLIAQLPRSSARELYAQRAAELYGFPPARLRAMLSEKSRPVPSTSPPPVSLSAAVRPPSPLPVGQAQLAALLVDAPHLAPLAREHRVVDYVTDPRLAPIVEAILRAAETGTELALDELLALVGEPDQRQVYQALFTGQYRGPGGNELAVDPTFVMPDLVNRIRMDRLREEIKKVDRDTEQARTHADEDALRALAQRRIELVRENETLKQRRSNAVSPPASHPVPK